MQNKPSLVQPEIQQVKNEFLLDSRLSFASRFRSSGILYQM